MLFYFLRNGHFGKDINLDFIVMCSETWAAGFLNGTQTQTQTPPGEKNLLSNCGSNTLTYNEAIWTFSLIKSCYNIARNEMSRNKRIFNSLLILHYTVNPYTSEEHCGFMPIAIQILIKTIAKIFILETKLSVYIGIIS